MTVEELRQRLQGVDGSRIVQVQVMWARRGAEEAYEETGPDGALFIISS